MLPLVWWRTIKIRTFSSFLLLFKRSGKWFYCKQTGKTLLIFTFLFLCSINKNFFHQVNKNVYKIFLLVCYTFFPVICNWSFAKTTIKNYTNKIRTLQNFLVWTFNLSHKKGAQRNALTNLRSKVSLSIHEPKCPSSV